MCIAIPMQVLSLSPGHAVVAGRGKEQRVDTALVDALAPGDWVLVFLDSARTRIDAATAAEVNATLDLVDAAMQQRDAAHDAALFALPSQLSAHELAAWTGQPGPSNRGNIQTGAQDRARGPASAESFTSAAGD